IQARLAPAGVRLGPLPLAGYQFLLGAYGGYFGGAMGIMMLAGWTVFGLGDVRTLNGMKTLMVSAARVIAVLIFAIWGHVYWQLALCMTVAAVAGGYLGARVTRRLTTDTLRR